ncbi:MAG TPA: ATP-binding protein [Verrucomicrobiae bacterium]|jgi:hypothetical protein|nr:ATP-binding protein [Verrucomicrobiae bacterium]
MKPATDSTVEFPIQEIDISGKGFEQYKIDSPDESSRKILGNLSKINIFVGPNNSGKSRFMREIAKTEKLRFKSAYHEFKNHENLRVPFQQDVRDIFMNNYIADMAGFPRKSDEIPNLSYIVEGDPIPTNFRECVEALRELQQQHKPQFRAAGPVGYPQPQPKPAILVTRLIERALVADRDLRSNVHNLPERLAFRKLYFPTLRGLRVLDAQNTDFYATKTKSDYFYAASPIQIFSGLGMYNEVRQHLLGSHEKRAAIARFEKFLAQNFYDKQPVTIIPREDKGILYIKIGKEAERPIHELGDGVQSIIALTFPLFLLSQSGAPVPLVFFEEPELYMHPGMQRLFLQTLCSFRGFQFFLTTHSNHLLDITLDIENVSLFSFSKQLENSEGEETTASFKIENLMHGNCHFLELLGVRNSSVFLSNCTVWVEGVTDRRYLRRYLELYMKSNPNIKPFLEDLHFSFVEYGGANITHWSFLDVDGDSIKVERLCGKLFLVADGDNATDGAKEARYRELAQKLKERFYRLPCKEIENLLSPEILKKVVSQYEDGSPEFNPFDQEAYRREGLGDFIETKMLKGPKKRRGSYREESGTVRGKVEFCEIALKHIGSFSDLSADAQAIATMIYEFIRSQNP